MANIFPCSSQIAHLECEAPLRIGVVNLEMGDYRIGDIEGGGSRNWIVWMEIDIR